MAKTTLTEQLAQAERDKAALREDIAVLKGRIEELKAQVADGNELRDQLMEVTLDRENMRGYLMRAAEDDPQPPIIPTPERRYASGPANSIDYSYHEFDSRNGYRSSNERPRRWYHR